MSHASSTVQPINPNFGVWTGYFFSINVVVGAGFLTIPAVFTKAGWVFCTIYMIFSALQSYFLAIQLVQVMSRVQIIARLRQQGKTIRNESFCQLLFGRKQQEPLLNEQIHMPQITDRRFDIAEITRVLFGNVAGGIYQFCLFSFCQGAMSAYAGIFTSSLAAEIPLGFLPNCSIYQAKSYGDLCYLNYWIFLAIFAVCMIVLVIIGIREQKWMQTVLTFCRFAIMSMIIILSLVLAFIGKEIDSDEDRTAHMPEIYNYLGTGSALSTILFSFIYQIQFPSICQFIKDKERNISKITKMVVITCFCFYLSLGLFVPLGISDLQSLVTIRFKDFSAGYSQDDRPWWTYAISYFVVLFPAADVFSSFPLMSITVSDNLLTLAYGAGNSKTVPKKGYVIFRVGVCVIPFVVTFLVYDLVRYKQGTIVDWVGTLSFIIVPIVIPLQHIAARDMVNQKSPYDLKFSPRWLSLATSAFSCVLAIVFMVFMGLGI